MTKHNQNLDFHSILGLCTYLTVVEIVVKEEYRKAIHPDCSSRLDNNSKLLLRNVLRDPRQELDSTILVVFLLQAIHGFPVHPRPR